jgi:hypothetical protein
LNDILIPASSFDQIPAKLDIGLCRLGQHGLKVEPEKCHLFYSELSFVGHLVSESAADPKNVRVIIE